MSELKFKPCPFCGGEAFVQKHLSELYRSVTCKQCYATTRAFVKEEQAVKAWNRRADNDRP